MAITCVATGNPAACSHSFALWQQATVELTCHDHSHMPWYASRYVQSFTRYIVSITRDWTPRSLYYCSFAPHIHGCCSLRISRLWWTAHSTQHQPRGCNSRNQPNLRRHFHKSAQKCLSKGY